MDPGAIDAAVVLAVLGAVIGGIVRLVFAHTERKIKICSQPGTQDSVAPAQQEALRDEIARLRDTSTQYDVSLQHALEDLQHRVASIEAAQRAVVAARPMAEDEPAVLEARRA